jgi:hypothetical protein
LRLDWTQIGHTISGKDVIEPIEQGRVVTIETSAHSGRT